MTKFALVLLALFGLLCLIGAIVLTAINKAVPSELWVGSSSALTGILGVLVPRDTVNQGESPVVNPL